MWRGRWRPLLLRLQNQRVAGEPFVVENSVTEELLDAGRHLPQSRSSVIEDDALLDERDNLPSAHQVRARSISQKGRECGISDTRAIDGEDEPAENETRIGVIVLEWFVPHQERHCIARADVFGEFITHRGPPLLTNQLVQWFTLENDHQIHPENETEQGKEEVAEDYEHKGCAITDSLLRYQSGRESQKDKCKE